MVGVCITAGGLIRVAERGSTLRTLSRAVLAADALVFLTGALASFAVSRAHVRGRQSRLEPIADAVMVLGLAGIVIACFTLLLTVA
jgi:hypothetical protein